LPTGLLGAFFLICILLMITTDDSRLFNASTAIIQDLVIPFKKKAMTPKQHMRLVKWLTVGVALFFFCMAILLAQLDYINMFLMIILYISCIRYILMLQRIYLGHRRLSLPRKSRLG